MNEQERIQQLENEVENLKGVVQNLDDRIRKICQEENQNQMDIAMMNVTS